ncbi:MAG: hypothetical protein ACNS63_02980 [Candidatus Nitrospinota bacterium M3_3B_026]
MKDPAFPRKAAAAERATDIHHDDEKENDMTRTETMTGRDRTTGLAALPLAVLLAAFLAACGSSSSDDGGSGGARADLMGNYILIKSSTPYQGRSAAMVSGAPATCDSDDVYCVEITEKTGDSSYRGSSNHAQHVFASWDADKGMYVFDMDMFTGTSSGPMFHFTINSDDTLTGYGCYSDSGDSDCYELDPVSKKYPGGQWPTGRVVERDNENNR